MAKIMKMKKYQTGGDVPKGMVRGERSEGKLYKKADNDKFKKSASDAMDKQASLGKYAPKKIVSKPKMEHGGKAKSFPDLNKDGKITKADILKGRGVIAKSGMKMKKQAAIAIAMKKAGKAPKANYGMSMMSKGGKMKMSGKCKNGC